MSYSSGGDFLNEPTRSVDRGGSGHRSVDDKTCRILASCRSRRWYARQRAKYRPRSVSFLLVAESPPPVEDPDEPRSRPFFYSPRLSHKDQLFRAVVEAVYGHSLPSGEQSAQVKLPWLDRLRDDGVYLIDLVPCPWGELESDSIKRRCRRLLGPRMVRDAAKLGPEGIVVCHKGVSTPSV